ncbi:F22C12.10 [Salix viminalis]|uniref:F22C12.10 n=1 Tax=Salix viminalis TaxID=40686 RepID=A0A9Q0QBH0_SALVM|nr:F22C12.10 [Salix viminalis]
MDNWIRNPGFAADYPSNAFKILGSSAPVGGVGTKYSADTVLRLDSPGSSVPYGSSSKGIKRKWNLINGSMGQNAGSSLSLGLGRSSSSSDSKGSSATACTSMSSAKETDEESSLDLELDFSLQLGNEKMLSPKKLARSYIKKVEFQPKVDLELGLSTGPFESDVASIHPHTSSLEFGFDMPLAMGGASNVDERSASCSWKSGITLLPLQNSVSKEASFFFNQIPRTRDPTPGFPDHSSSVITPSKSSVTCTSGISQQQQPYQRSTSLKLCQFEGCGKGARGASGRCISHGGGRRCQKTGCLKGAEGRTVYCKAHGGGRRCEFLGCTKSAEGRTDFCIAHGGGRRCSREGCTRAARGKSGLCIRHGGGKRCQKENCTKSAEGLSGLCISHGGGRRCQFLGCTKGAQGSTMFCKAHGGGKRCTAPGCTKGAEGSTPFCKGHGGGKRCAFQGGGICTKSVHGGTNFCVAHGGGKRCAVPECTKSARGRTDFCVRHGGGKRCKFEACGKSAQGSTDYCKAHGGGKRCSWGHPGSEYSNQPPGPCNSFARSKTGLCALHSGLVQDKRVHGGVTLGPMVQDPNISQSEKMKEAVTAEDMTIGIVKTGTSTPASGRTTTNLKHFGDSSTSVSVREAGLSSLPAFVSEGRVHGGSLMAMIASVSGGGSSNNQVVAGDPSEPKKSYVIP